MKTKQIKSITIITPAALERPISALMAQITFDAEGNAAFNKGANLSPVELAYVAREQVQIGDSAYLRGANALILARQLPPVKTKGEKGEDIETPAFDVAAQALRGLFKTDSQYYATLGMVNAVDVVTLNKLPVSPFVVKEAMGTLNRLNALPKKGELKLTNGTDGKAKSLVSILKNGGDEAKVNAIRPVLQKLNEAAGRKPAKKKGAATVPPPEPETIAREVQSLIGNWDKAVAKYGVQKVREAASANVETLAKLAGFAVTKLEQKK